MIRSDSKAFILVAIGFLLIAVGVAGVPKILVMQIPFVIGAGFSFVLALYYTMRTEKPIPN